MTTTTTIVDKLRILLALCAEHAQHLTGDTLISGEVLGYSEGLVLMLDSDHGGLSVLGWALDALTDPEVTASTSANGVVHVAVRGTYLRQPVDVRMTVKDNADAERLLAVAGEDARAGRGSVTVEQFRELAAVSS